MCVCVVYINCVHMAFYVAVYVHFACSFIHPLNVVWQYSRDIKAISAGLLLEELAEVTHGTHCAIVMLNATMFSSTVCNDWAGSPNHNARWVDRCRQQGPDNTPFYKTMRNIQNIHQWWESHRFKGYGKWYDWHPFWSLRVQVQQVLSVCDKITIKQLSD